MKVGDMMGRELTLVLNERRLDTDSAPLFHNELLRTIDGATSLVVDMASVVYISSAGLRVLLAAQHAMGEGSTLTLRNVNEEVMHTLDITGFIDIFTVEPAGHEGKGLL